jgi:signal transduction histidine kinase
LLDNAIKFTRLNGTVTLDAAVSDGQLSISVTDDGPGIPAAELQHVWDSFLQMSSSLERGLQGLGLGLAMARCIVEAHNGQISVKSKMGAGSTFTIALPVPKTA